MAPTERAFALALMLHIWVSCGGGGGFAAPCSLTCTNSSLPNFFNVEYDADARSASAPSATALSLPNHMVSCAMAPAAAAESRCSVDVESLIEPYTTASDDVLISLSLDYSGSAAAAASGAESSSTRSGPPEIQFASYGRSQKKNVVMLFTLINLAFSWREIDRLASLVNLVVLKLVDCTVIRSSPPAPSAGPASAVVGASGGGGSGSEGAEVLGDLGSIMTLALTVSAARGGSGAAPINSWLPDGVVFPHMAELHIVCAAAAADDGRRDAKNSNILQNVVQIQSCDNPIDVLPLAAQMPRLQVLELTNFASVAAVPPSFPWHAERLRLPRNLSRTPFFHSHYTNRNSLALERNVYRRMLTVRGSRALTHAAGCGIAAGIDRVDLDRNALAYVAPDCFAGATSLQYLRLNDNRLTNLEPDVFASLGNLTRLYLQGNLIAQLDGRVFRGLVSLQYLNLASNRLCALGGGAFEHLTKLRYLSLRGNVIATVETSAFPVGSTELGYLLLGRNRLADVPPIAFRLRNTLALELSDNEITFDNLARTLSQIDADDARVYSVESISELDESNQLSAQNTRTKIDLRRNRVRSFPKTALRPAEMRNLEFVSKWFELDLEENPIECDCHAFRFRRDLQSAGAAAGGFESWKCQTPPEVRGVSFFAAPSKTFSCAEPMDGCPAPCECRRRSIDNATVVDCRNRSLTAMPDSLPAPASADGELILDLRGNRVEALPEAAAAYGALGAVTSLLLSGNALSSVDGGAMGAMTRLRELALDNNKLTNLPLDVRAAAAELGSLTLRANYWPCDCSNDWMKAWLQRQRSIVSDLYQVTCSSSRDSVRGVPITEVNDDDFVCVDEQYHLKVAVGVSATLLALTLLCVGLTYRYFSTIKIVLYAKFYWHPFDRIDEQADASMQYDVFVSYSSHDCDWVLGTLCTVLEKRVVPPLRTCVHDKDFTVGCSIHDNILASVRRSRRMVVVLSESFVRSDWCMLEFRTAHEKVMKERGAYLVVVLLDDIDVASLDESLRAYLSTNTYLHVGNRWFWSKLLYAMPQGTRPRLHPDLPPPSSRRPPGAGRSKVDCDDSDDVKDVSFALAPV